MAQPKINVRIAHAYSIFKEEGADATESGKPYDIHITGFDEAGHPVRPIVGVPRTHRVMRAIQEGRLIDVDRTEGGLEGQQADVERLRDVYKNSTGVATQLFGTVASNDETREELQKLGVVDDKRTPEQKAADEDAKGKK